MNFLDLIIILPLIYAAYKGFKHGFIIELFTLLAIIVGIYVGIHFPITLQIGSKIVLAGPRNTHLLYPLQSPS